MKSILDTEVEKRLIELRNYEEEFICKYGSLKRIYKLVGVNLEIKFSKAKMLLQESLDGKQPKHKMQMIEMMFRAYTALEKQILERGFKPLAPQIRVYEYGKGKLAYICDYDDEKANMIKQYEKETDVVFFSMEELLRCIPSEFMDAKRLLTKRFGDANFARIIYEKVSEKKEYEQIDKKSYKYQVEDNLKNFVKINIDFKDIKKANNFVNELIEKKKQESHHIRDFKSMHKRFMNGILGEIAIEKFTNKKFIDWTIGDSKKYTYSDLKPLGLKIGVKTSTYGTYPLIARKNNESQIIVLKYFKDNEFYICGIATKDVLNKYQSDEFVNDKNAIKNKTAFYGFRELIHPNKLREIL